MLERPVFTKVKGRIKRWIFLQSNYTLFQSTARKSVYFNSRTQPSLPISCHIRVQIMDKDNDEVHKNNARLTATFKHGWSRDTWTSAALYLALPLLPFSLFNF